MKAVDGLELLIREIGHGVIQATLTVDQIYAHRQHEELTWKHPHGGRAKYLEAPLFEHSDEIIRKIADKLITVAGSDILAAMIEVSELMSQWVEENAPVLTGELRLSGHPQVWDDEVLVYDRPPKMPRINKDYIKPTRRNRFLS